MENASEYASFLPAAFYLNLLRGALSTILKPCTPMKLWLTTCSYVTRPISTLLWRICVPVSWQLQRKKSKVCSTRWEPNTLLLSSTILRGSLMKCRNSARNKPFAPNNKTKALLLQRKPYCQNESLSNRFVMHPKRKVGASFVYGLSVGFWGKKEDDGTEL